MLRIVLLKLEPAFSKLINWNLFPGKKGQLPPAMDLPWDHVNCHIKFGPDRFNRFDVYWIQTNRLIDRQSINEDMKMKYSLNMNLFISRRYGGRFPNIHKQNLIVFQDFRLNNILILKYLYFAYTMHCNMQLLFSNIWKWCIHVILQNVQNKIKILSLLCG